MRGWIIGVHAVLSAGVVHAQGVAEPYAKVGDWEISTENHRGCAMTRWFAGSAADDEQLLSILYDAQRKAAALGWVMRKPKFPPLSHTLDFYLTFTRKGSVLNETWGSQPFQIQKRADAYTFTHAFNALADSDRFLRDLASHDTIGLWFGPTLMAALPLHASDAVAKLRECSSKIVEHDTSDRLQK